MWRLTRLSRFHLKPDPSLVSLPAGVGRVDVYRNVVTSEEEQCIWDELNLVLEREGQAVHLESSTPQNKIVKHTYLEMHGDEPFTEVKSFQRKEVRRLPGLVWSPTLLRVLRAVAPPLLGALPDTARVVEHVLPGYELHTEHPAVGRGFLYLSLLSDAVLSFDDEATGRRGSALLPQRALMHCAGEARWGWRFGEAPRAAQTFVAPSGARRTVETDMRLSVQVWRFTPQLLDARLLQDRVEQAMQAKVEREGPVQSRESEFTAATGAETGGAGPLGGDYVPPQTRSNAKTTMGDLARDYSGYKQQFQEVHSVLQEMKVMQDAGKPVNDMWLKKKLTAGQRDEEQDARDGFNADDVEGTWNRVDARARFYKAKLKRMDYDGTTKTDSGIPDVSGDAPLDMRKTIRKIAPLVKDGEKILASLPGDHSLGQ